MLKLKYLSFGFSKDGREKEWKCRLHRESVKKFKSRLKELIFKKVLTKTGLVSRFDYYNERHVLKLC